MAVRGVTDPVLRQLLTEIEERPRDVSLHRKLGLLCWRSGRLVEAVIEFRKILVIQPGHREAPFALAALHHQRGHFAKAYELLFGIACPENSRSIEKRNHGLPVLNPGALVFTAGDFPSPYDSIEWKDFFEELEKKVRTQSEFIERRMREGVLCLEHRCYDKAIRIFTFLATLDRRNPLIRLHRAAALSARRRDAEAEMEFHEAIMLQPTNPIAYKGLGQVRARRGDEAKARQAFEQVLKLDPADVEARRWIERTG